MRNVAILGIVCLGTLGLMSGCSDGTAGSGGAGGSDASSSSSSSGTGTSSSSSGGGGMTSSSSSSSSSSSGMLINGCDKTTAANHLADAKVTISVGANGFSFDPPCVRVKAGTDINFVGAFGSHPIVGGLVGAPAVPDPSSPIKETLSGTSVTFTIPLAGTFPFYCEYHQPDMAGVVFAE